MRSFCTFAIALGRVYSIARPARSNVAPALPVAPNVRTARVATSTIASCVRRIVLNVPSGARVNAIARPSGRYSMSLALHVPDVTRCALPPWAGMRQMCDGCDAARAVHASCVTSNASSCASIALWLGASSSVMYAISRPSGRQLKPPTPRSASVTRSASPPSTGSTQHLRRLLLAARAHERDAVAAGRPDRALHALAVRREHALRVRLQIDQHEVRERAVLVVVGAALDRDEPARVGRDRHRAVRDDAADVAQLQRPRRGAEQQHRARGGGGDSDQAVHHFIHLSNHSVQMRMRASRSTGSVGLWPLRGNSIMRTFTWCACSAR